MSKKKTLRIALGITLIICGGLTTSLVLIIRESQTGHSRPCCGGNITFDLSRKGDEIAFSVPVANGMDIYLLNIPSNKVSRLLTSEKYEWAPRFSSDGSKIAFSGGVPGERGDHIFLFDRKANKTVQLTQGLNNDTWPSFYDHDHKIVFTRETKYRWGGLASNWDDAGRVHTLDIETGDIKLENAPSLTIISPEILASGLLFLNDFLSIRTIDMKTNIEKVLVKDCRDARISADEKSIVFTGGGYKDDYLIHVKSLPEGRVHGVNEGNQNQCSNPILSRDGKSIYFIEETNDSYAGEKRSLNRIDRDGKNPVELFDFKDAQAFQK